jgi:tetratricopeptide (TPR) repeat protein
MTRAIAHKGTAEQKSTKTARSMKKLKQKAVLGSPPKKSVLKQKVSPVKARPHNNMAASKNVKSPAKHPVNKESKIMEAEIRRKPAPAASVSSIFDTSTRLIRETKATTAALMLLEKGIEFIYKKDFHKARNELKELLKSYPAETEILARARSYIQICDREESSQKKPAIDTEQLYALGVVEHNKANYDTAISCFRKMLENHPKADYIYYSVAASLAMKGNIIEAIENLRKAIELNEDSRIYAKNDSDFSSLLSEKEFAELVGISQPA